jgi:hypothetical protein
VWIALFTAIGYVLCRKKNFSLGKAES